VQALLNLATTLDRAGSVRRSTPHLLDAVDSSPTSWVLPLLVAAGIGLATLCFLERRGRRPIRMARIRAAQTELLLAEASQRYQSLFDRNPHAVYSLSGDGDFTVANDACETVSRYRPDEMLGMNFAQLIHPKDLDRAVQSFLRAMRGLPEDFEGTIVHKDGGTVDLQVTALPIVIADEVVGVHGDGRHQRSTRARSPTVSERGW